MHKHVDDVLPAPLEANGERAVSRRLHFAHSTLQNVGQRLTLTLTTGSVASVDLRQRNEWVLDRDLNVHALADAFVYSAERPGLADPHGVVELGDRWLERMRRDTLPHAQALIERDARAFRDMALLVRERMAGMLAWTQAEGVSDMLRELAVAAPLSEQL